MAELSPFPEFGSDKAEEVARRVTRVSFDVTEFDRQRALAMISGKLGEGGHSLSEIAKLRFLEFLDTVPTVNNLAVERIQAQAEYEEQQITTLHPPTS